MCQIKDRAVAGLAVDAVQDQLLRRGQPVDLSVDAFPGRMLRGTVDSFAPASGAQFSLLPPENATGNFTKVVQRVPVRIEIEAQDRARLPLRPGMSVVVEVDTRDRPGLLYDLTRTLAANHIQIVSAVIATYGAQVVDSFYVKDMFGLKLHSPAKRDGLEKKLRTAIADGVKRAEAEQA